METQVPIGHVFLIAGAMVAFGYMVRTLQLKTRGDKVFHFFVLYYTASPAVREKVKDLIPLDSRLLNAHRVIESMDTFFNYSLDDAIKMMENEA